MGTLRLVSSHNAGTFLDQAQARHEELAKELRAWARDEDVAEHLSDPATQLLPLLKGKAFRHVDIDPTTLVSALLRRDTTPSGIYHYFDTEGVIGLVREYLELHRERKKAAAERRALWKNPLPTAQLELLAAQLKELLVMGADQEPFNGPLLCEDLHVELDTRHPVVTFVFEVSDTTWRTGGYRSELPLDIDLAGLEEGIVRWSCDCRAKFCPHLRFSLEWMLDCVYEGHKDFVEPLTKMLSTPAWARFLEELESTGEQEEDEKDDPQKQRVAWRISLSDQTIGILPVIQRLQKNGRWSPGAVQGGDSKGTRLSRESIQNALAVADERDQRALAHMMMYSGDAGPYSLAVETKAAAFEALVGHPRLFLLESPKTAVTLERARPVVMLADSGSAVALGLQLGTQDIDPVEALDTLFMGTALITFDAKKNRFFLARASASLVRFLSALAAFPTSVPPEGQGRLIKFLSNIQDEVDLRFPTSLRGEVAEPNSDVFLRLAPLPAGGLEARVLVRPLDGAGCWPAGRGPAQVLAESGKGRRTSCTRDFEQERKNEKALHGELGLSDTYKATEEGVFHVTDVQDALELVYKAQRLAPSLTVEWLEQEAWKVASTSVADLRVRVKSQVDWFKVDGEAEVDGIKIPLKTLLKAHRDGQRYVKLGAGKFARITKDLTSKLEQTDGVLHEKDRKTLAVGSAGASKLDRLFQDLPAIKTDKKWQDLLGRIEKAQGLEPVVPKELKATLREYQVDGFAWLARLSAWDAGCCLADDMGLGKTVQTLALLLSRASKGPALVVAPTSVTSVWVEQTEQFAPSLATIVYRGKNRKSLLANAKKGCLVVTSYDILALDVGALKKVPFDTLVLDEAQAIKNAKTKRAAAARQIKAPFRLALTGTPMENHLGELWSLLAAINPGLLGPWERFRDRYAVPIERYSMDGARKDLAALIRPFVLRRTKAQVATDLPPRTEVVRPVELSVGETKLYDSLRKSILESMLDQSFETKQAGQKRFHLLAGITKLRRLACNARLVDENTILSSTKLETTISFIERFVQEEDRALIFSQFTGHLALLREQLDKRAIPYLYLDGSTPQKKRAQLVKTWAKGEEAFFLISLKAGGTGLNLMGADYVLHLDPWWNPAVEDQATDRTHRIGQTKPVTVIRLIAQGTIEEAVIGLHNKKRELARSLLEGTEAVGKLSTDQLVSLIEYGGEVPGAVSDL